MPKLATIGYQGCTIDVVLNTLREAQIGLLIDIRAIAQSRKPGFSKRQLAAALDQVGIGYVHLRGLGTPKPGRDAVRAGHPERMAVIFREHMTSHAAETELAQAKILARERPVCLLCFERDYTTCHRQIVAEMITIDTEQSLVHLSVPGPDKVSLSSGRTPIS